MSLLQSQRDMQAHILSESASTHDSWDVRMTAGMAIYRNAYRSRLIEALQETVPKTCEWVGEESFARAAAHHLITTPPSGWTLDEIGLGFPEVLAELFTGDPEVSELAWLEWAMHCAFTAADTAALNAESFSAATAEFTEADWASLRLDFVPGTACRLITTACDAIWKAVSRQDRRPDRYRLDQPAGLIVWREGLSPVFQRIEALEAECIWQMQAGESFSALCEFMLAERGEAGIAEAGTMLGNWIARGHIAACEARPD